MYEPKTSPEWRSTVTNNIAPIRTGILRKFAKLSNYIIPNFHTVSTKHPIIPSPRMPQISVTFVKKSKTLDSTPWSILQLFSKWKNAILALSYRLRKPCLFEKAPKRFFISPSSGGRLFRERRFSISENCEVFNFMILCTILFDLFSRHQIRFLMIY